MAHLVVAFMLNQNEEKLNGHINTNADMCAAIDKTCDADTHIFRCCGMNNPYLEM